MTAETILHAAIGVLQRRGRCRGHFETRDGKVCQLGALAIAAGFDADIWRFWRDLEVEDLDGAGLALVDAARILAKVEGPLQPVGEMSLDRLVTLLGDSNDITSDAEIFDSLTKAAHEAGLRVQVAS